MHAFSLQAALSAGRPEADRAQISTLNCNLASLDYASFNKAEPPSPPFVLS